MSKQVPDTRGRHALLAILDEKSQKDLAKATRVGQPTLSLIKDQFRLPGREVAAKLAKIGIEYGWWGVPPTRGQLSRDEQRRVAKEQVA